MVIIKLPDDPGSHMYVFTCENCGTIFGANFNEVDIDLHTLNRWCRCPVCRRDVYIEY